MFEEDVVAHGAEATRPAVPDACKEPGLWLTGIGAQYPPYLSSIDRFENYVKRFYDVENHGIKKLLEINRNTGIETRSTIRSFESGLGSNRSTLPDVSEQDAFFRKAGVNLTIQACKKALKEWGGVHTDITHTVGVTCTTTGNPGYDLLVAQKLNLRDDLDRTLLHGVGCAGGLAAMRAAAQLANGASLRRRPVRILVYACELCSLYARSDLEVAARSSGDETNITPALFSDGAAAFVLCNELAPEVEQKAIFQLIDWANARIPGTEQEMSFLMGPNGYWTTLSKGVPSYTSKAIAPMFDKLLPSFMANVHETCLSANDFDWALHPGGLAILEGAQESMQLSSDHLKASYEIYKTHGNSSSPTVLIVLDKVRKMGEGRDNIVATAFGPGLAIEMAMLKRCRKPKDKDRDGLEDGS